MRERPVGTSRFSERERRRILHEGHQRGKKKKVCKQYGISVRTFYRWQAMAVRDEKERTAQLRQLQRENRNLKRQFAELSLDYQSLRAALIAEAKSEC
jgi:putative transposase